jgi:hypothetical protein
MGRFRLTVAGLMGLVVYAAAGLAAVKSPTPAWAGTMLMLALTALAIATIGAVYRRHFAFGFAVVGWGYLAVVFGPWLDARVGTRLLTTILADRLYLRVEYAPRETGERAWADVDGENHEGTIVGIDTESKPFPVYSFAWHSQGGGLPSRFMAAWEIKPIDRQGYRDILHSLACPMISCLGGFAALSFCRSGRGGTPCDAPSSQSPE